MVLLYREHCSRPVSHFHRSHRFSFQNSLAWWMPENNEENCSREEGNEGGKKKFCWEARQLGILLIPKDAFVSIYRNITGLLIQPGTSSEHRKSLREAADCQGKESNAKKYNLFKLPDYKALCFTACLAPLLIPSFWKLQRQLQLYSCSVQVFIFSVVFWLHGGEHEPASASETKGTEEQLQLVTLRGKRLRCAIVVQDAVRQFHTFAQYSLTPHFKYFYKSVVIINP